MTRMDGGSSDQGLEAVSVRNAQPGDLAAVTRLLEEAGLPTLGVEAALDRFTVAEMGARLVGVAGLEVHGGDGVLRSVAVSPDARGRGLGGRLTEQVLEGGRRAGLREIYLLTTTAEEYFPRHGFRQIERSAVSPDVLASVEFAEACPASAVVMILDTRTRVRE